MRLWGGYYLIRTLPRTPIFPPPSTLLPVTVLDTCGQILSDSIGEGFRKVPEKILEERKVGHVYEVPLLSRGS